MTKLTAKQESFIALMLKSEEHARRGFDVLLARPGYEKLFDALEEAGLFNPSRNPAPIPAGEPGYVRIPYWDALDYLEAVAKLSGERNDIHLAENVLAVVKTVSEAFEENPSTRDNYHTNRKFAEILGFVPTTTITEAHLSFIPEWLEGKYDQGMVCHALSKGAMHRFLGSQSPDDWIKACTILRYCTAVIWIDEAALGEKRKRPATVTEDHWLKELINHHTKELGRRAGKLSAEILLDRLREVFDQQRRNVPSWLHRPAVEDNAQNHEWLGPENRFVDGLRDVLLSWVDSDTSTAKPFIEKLLTDTSEMVRRIGIYVIGQRWEILGQLYSPLVHENFFTDGHLHELYCLLKNQFESFSASAKASTIEAIRHLEQATTDEEHLRQLKRVQRKWLSAVIGKGYEPADQWFKSLMTEHDLGGVSEHPEFHSYMEIQRGPGPSPYQVQELLAFAELGSVVEELNSFQELDTWRGPTVRALVDSLEEAVILAPTTFLKLLPKFVSAKRPFQFGVIEGFRRLWIDADQTSQSIDWNTAWEELIRFFEQLIQTSDFWTEQVIEDHNRTPNRDWIPPAIADCIKAGTRSDNKAYSPSLLSRTWALLQILLDKLEYIQDAPRSDATNQTINWPRGKAIEALFIHALRECRVGDQTRKEHSGVWEIMKPTFDAQLAKCQNANFEFSTMAGNYLPNLEYMAPEWLRVNIGRIFPSTFRDNLKCALDGLAYTTVSDSLYDQLVKSGVIELALCDQDTDRRVRERLIERISLAYISGNEQLDSPIFGYLFQPQHLEDLQDACGCFWDIREEQLSPEHIARILQFWDRCVGWSRGLPTPPTALLSSLSRLSCYLQGLGSRETEWLLAVAPHVKVNYNYDFFLEELDRLVDTNPTEVSTVMKAFLDSYLPDYDFEDRLKSIIRKLAQLGKRQDAINYAEKLRHLSGMLELYTNLGEIAGKRQRGLNVEESKSG
ncbi:MAG: hypothetical protein RI101_11860 [Nitrospira sp.]|jgi:hypothetical protein|nr:hypothetical protein [Nitrospira sp.]